MPRNFIGRFQVRLQDRFLDVAPALVAARVHVHGHQRLRLVDHDVTAAPQPDLAMEGVVDLFLDAESLEDRRRAVVEPNPVARPARDLAHHRVHPIDRGLIVADYLVDVFREKIPHRALDQVRLFKNAAGRRLVFDQLLDPCPLLDQHTEVANEIARALALPDGADDHAHAFGNFQAAQNLAQTIALLRVLDLA